MTTPRTIARPSAVGGSVPQLIFGDLWEYDPAPETADPKLKPKYDLFIGGKFVAPKSGKYFESVNPATEEVLAEIALASPADVDAAYHAAQKAFTPWSKLPGAERGISCRIARRQDARASSLSPRRWTAASSRVARLDVPMAAPTFLPRGWADKLEYACCRSTRRRRAGDTVGFPLLMLAGKSRRRWRWKHGRSQARGTTSVTALKFLSCCSRAELPPGVVNFVCGAGETGRPVVGHPPRQDRIQGSTEVGKLIVRQLAGTDKKLSWSSEGKPYVFDGSPIDQAVEGVVSGIFFNQGHRLLRGKRAARAGIDCRDVRVEAQEPHRRASRGQSIAEHRRRAINSKAQIGGSASWSILA